MGSEVTPPPGVAPSPAHPAGLGLSLMVGRVLPLQAQGCQWVCSHPTPPRPHADPTCLHRFSAEAALRQAGAALGQGRGPHSRLLGGGPGQQRLTGSPSLCIQPLWRDCPGQAVPLRPRQAWTRLAQLSAQGQARHGLWPASCTAAPCPATAARCHWELGWEGLGLRRDEETARLLQCQLDALPSEPSSQHLRRL